MDNVVKKELMYVGLLTVGALIIVLILSMVLPLRPNPLVNPDANKPAEQLAQESCVTLCTANVASLKTVENGPCLSDLFKFDVNDYVCDIVNEPRIAVDDLNVNQCQEFLNGDKNYFVEVNTKCELVKTQ